MADRAERFSHVRCARKERPAPSNERWEALAVRPVLLLSLLFFLPSCCDPWGAPPLPSTTTPEQDVYELCKTMCRSMYQLQQLDCKQDSACLDRLKQDYYCVPEVPTGIPRRPIRG